MSDHQSSDRTFPWVAAFSALAVAGTLVSSVALPSFSQGLPGLTIFSGVERENQLSYRMDFFGERGARDRYRLRIPSDKLEVAVSEFFIDYPDTYEGEFDAEEVAVKVDGEEVGVDEAVWDPENRVIEIYPTEAVPANSRVEIVLSNVRNPRNVGTHYFNALVVSPGDIPLRRYIGTWIITIGDDAF